MNKSWPCPSYTRWSLSSLLNFKNVPPNGLARCLARFWPILVETFQLKTVISLQWHLEGPIWSVEKRICWAPNGTALMTIHCYPRKGCDNALLMPLNMEWAPVAKVVVRFKDVVLFHSFSVLDMATSLRYSTSKSRWKVFEFEKLFRGWFTSPNCSQVMSMGCLSKEIEAVKQKPWGRNLLSFSSFLGFLFGATGETFSSTGAGICCTASQAVWVSCCRSAMRDHFQWLCFAVNWKFET